MWKLKHRERYAVIEQDEANPLKHRGTFYIGPRHVKHHITKEFVEYAYVVNPTFASMANCEYAGTNKNQVVGVRLLVDGVERGIDHFSPVISNQFKTFSPFGMISFDAGNHTISLEARCVDANQTISVRRKRLLVMKH